MKLGLPVAALLALAACDEAAVSGGTSVPKGPAIEITEAARAFDTTRVAMRYKNGGEIASDDESRAVLKGASIACMEGEQPILDTRKREAGILTINYFCVGVTTSDETIDGTRLKT